MCDYLWVFTSCWTLFPKNEVKYFCWISSAARALIDATSSCLRYLHSCYTEDMKTLPNTCREILLLNGLFISGIEISKSISLSLSFSLSLALFLALFLPSSLFFSLSPFIWHTRTFLNIFSFILVLYIYICVHISSLLHRFLCPF